MPKSIALCGAGTSAAKPLNLPTTFQFFQRTLNENLDPAHPLGLLASKQTLKALLAAMFKSPNVEGYDLETFYQYLGWVGRTDSEFIKLTSFLFNQVRHYDWLQHKGKIDLKSVWPIYANMSEYYGKAFDWLEQVARTLRRSFHWEYDVTTERGSKAKEVYEPLIRLLIDLNSTSDETYVFNRVPIYTLNWDTAWEAMRSNEQVQLEMRGLLGLSAGELMVEDGFVEREREFVYEPESWLNATGFKGITLARLHGSILWRRNQRSSGVSYSTIRDYPDPHSGQEPCLIYPADKDEAVESEPWKSLFKYFVDTLQQSDLLIVIGYSFRDEHINRLVLESLVSESQLKIVIVNPESQGKLTESDPSAKRFFENLPEARFEYISSCWPEALDEVRRRILTWWPTLDFSFNP